MIANDNRSTIEVTMVRFGAENGAASMIRCLGARLVRDVDGDVRLDVLTNDGVDQVTIHAGDAVYFDT